MQEKNKTRGVWNEKLQEYKIIEHSTSLFLFS